MDFIKGLTGTSPTTGTIGPARAKGTSEETTSLLGDWTNYQNKGQGDVEAGGASTSTSTAALLTSVEGAASKVAGFFQDGYQKVSTGATTAVTTASETFSLPSGQALVYFFSFLGGGCVFLILAFTLFLPTIILSPSKFALSFTLGSLCTMGAFTMLRGWKQQLEHMFSRERLPFSAAYLGSVGTTLYAALIMHSYLLCLLCSGLQVVALLYYLMSYFPGGTAGVKVALSLFYSAAMQCFGAVTRIVLK